MYIHRKARTTPLSRLRIVEKIEAGAPVSQVARDAEISRQTAYKWLRRWRSGDTNLNDHATVARVQPRWGPHTVERATCQSGGFQQRYVLLDGGVPEEVLPVLRR